MTRLSFAFLIQTLFILLIISFQSAVSFAANKPNIVLILADDAGYADFGFQKITAPEMAKLTPNIDSISRSGIRFTNGYVSGCVCSPTRAGLLTGRYQQRFGHEKNIPPGYMKGGMSLKEKTFADRMKAAGYKTACLGKWHLGYPSSYHPNQRGFDYFYGCLQGSRSYFPYKKPSAHRVIQENGRPTKEEGYVTDRLGKAAVRFIEKNKKQPFFLYLAFTAPHGPMHAKEKDLANLMNIKNIKRRKYAGMVKSMDDNVGFVLQALKQHGLEENTLVIFTNDNGGQTLTGAVNTPLRGRKGTLYEGGTRVPMCIKWPAKIKPAQVIHEPVIALDFLPTFLAAANTKVDPKWKLDGMNLLPRLTGQIDSLKQRPLFWRSTGPKGYAAVRLGDWKLFVPRKSDQKPAALYNLKDDISETTDLAAKYPEKVKQLSKLLSDWQKELIDPLWGTAKRNKKKKKGKNKKRKN